MADNLKVNAKTKILELKRKHNLLAKDLEDLDLPKPSISDNGKVLGVDASGKYALEEGSSCPINTYEVTNISNISSEILEQLKRGDEVLLNDSSEYEYKLFIVVSGQEGLDLTLANVSNKVIDSIYYFKDGDVWNHGQRQFNMIKNIVANPSGPAIFSLSKLEIDSMVYGISAFNKTVNVSPLNTGKYSFNSADFSSDDDGKFVALMDVYSPNTIDGVVLVKFDSSTTPGKIYLSGLIKGGFVDEQFDADYNFHEITPKNIS